MELQRGESRFICNKPMISLVDTPSSIVPKILAIWDASKLTEEAMMNKYGKLFPNTTDIELWMNKSEHNRQHAYDVAKKCLSSEIPVVKNVELTIQFRDTSTVFRSHLVRHSGITGHWARSNRLRDLKEFTYSVPALVMSNPEALEVWLDQMEMTRKNYLKLKALGIMEEDCREILPVCHTQTIISTISLHALAHIINVRSSWFASEFWTDIVSQLMEAIRTLEHGDVIADALAPKIPTSYHPNEIEALTRFPEDLNDPQGPRIDDNPIDPIMYKLLVDRGNPMKPYKDYILPKAMDKAKVLKAKLSKVWTGEALRILETVMEEI